jgi:UPF0755 protein
MLGGSHDPRTTRSVRPPSPAERSEPTRAPERPKGQRRRKRKSSRTIGLLSGLFTSAVVVTIAIASALMWFQYTVKSPGPLTETRPFTVERNARTREIAAKLEQAGIIDSRNMFMAHYFSQSALNRLGASKRPLTLKAGNYEFEAGASVDDVMAVLEGGRSVARFITFPEGMTSAAIVARLSSDERLTGTIAEVPPEGSLMPATYDIRPGMERASVIERMTREKNKLIEDLWPTRDPSIPIATPEEALILASIVQREMGPNDDPERIAAVFHNRLRKGMRLESDPTILYGLYGSEVKWGTPIYRSQIRKQTPHNTYTIKGLPPTPIANAGRAAIKAVLNPAKTEDLYFVADGRGGHFFAKTLAEHNRNVQRWREIEREIRARQKAEAEREAREAKAAAENRQAAAPVATRTVATQGVLRPTQETETVRGVRVVSASAGGQPASEPEEDVPGVVPLPIRKPRNR